MRPFSMHRRGALASVCSALVLSLFLPASPGVMGATGVGAPPLPGAEVLFDGSRAMLDRICGKGDGAEA